MRATSIIYRRELGRYLKSPIGWIMAAAVLLIDGIIYYAMAFSGGETLSADVLTTYFNWGSGIPLFLGVLLSFRLISEERQTQSITLLNTAPVRDYEIVLGKFFAALTFLAGVLLVSLYMPLLIKVEGKITWSQILVGYIGLLLMGSASLAIGVFASALTRQQIVAALLGAVIVAPMCFLYLLAKKLDAPVSTVIGQLDLWWSHYKEGFMRSVLNLKDVVFYIAVTYFFLFAAVKTLEAKRWR
jgi:ABC-2 type transport system permease protein